MNRKTIIDIDIFLNAPVVRLIRMGVLLLLTGGVLWQILQETNPTRMVGVLLLGIVLEVFLRTKIARTYPSKSIQ